MTAGTTLTVLGLAAVDTLSPAVIGVSIYLLLSRPRRHGLLLGVYLATVAVAYFGLGVALMLGAGAVAPRVDPAVMAWVQGAAGVILFGASWFIPDRRPGRAAVQVRRYGVPAMVVLGLGTWLVEFCTAIPYFAAVAIMTAVRLAPADWLALLGAYVIIMILPGVILAAAHALLGERTRARFQRWRQRLDSGSRATLRWIVGIAGVLVFIDALPSQLTISVGV